MTNLALHASRALASAHLDAGAQLRLRLRDTCMEDILRLADLVGASLMVGGKLLLLGNGGSAADAQHIAAEFTGRYLTERRPLAALALTTDTSALTAIGNDYGVEHIFARQIRALGRKGDVVLAISTSGRSPNITEGLRAATELGLTTVLLTSQKAPELAERLDLVIRVPSDSTPLIQECHLAIGHILCGLIDQQLDGASEA
jgi:D-sedoheptulose 7-phosphate isomerase